MNEGLDKDPDIELSEFGEFLSSCVLGETDSPLLTESASELRMATLHMAAQTRYSLFIVSRHLDAALYDNPEFLDALIQLVRRGKRSTIHILVMDSTPAVKNGHRLIPLAQQLSSFIKIRKLHDNFKEYNRAFMVADEKGVILREASDRHEAEINYHAPHAARHLLNFFNEAWEISEPDPQLRRLYL